MKQITLDGNILADASRMHDYLKEVLNFPEYYGKNLDALYDCLTDLENMEITIDAPEHDSAIFQKVVRLFKAAANSNEDIKLNII